MSTITMSQMKNRADLLALVNEIADVMAFLNWPSITLSAVESRKSKTGSRSLEFGRKTEVGDNGEKRRGSLD